VISVMVVEWSHVCQSARRGTTTWFPCAEATRRR
jgi:hypothetical protein